MENIETVDTLNAGRVKINTNFLELYSYDNNLTTVDLTLTDLNTTYPNARVGFEVFCESVTGTKHLYKKSESGWVRINFDLVV